MALVKILYEGEIVATSPLPIKLYSDNAEDVISRQSIHLQEYKERLDFYVKVNKCLHTGMSKHKIPFTDKQVPAGVLQYTIDNYGHYVELNKPIYYVSPVARYLPLYDIQGDYIGYKDEFSDSWFYYEKSNLWVSFELRFPQR